MRIECVAFTAKGVQLALRIAGILCARGDVCKVSAPEKYAREGVLAFGSLSQWTERAFSNADGLVFACACGIAVRSVAPYLCSKFTDPAVVAVDDCGQFAVPLVSGHVGGANILAKYIASEIGARAVITTATDANGVFSVDTWASQNGFLVMRPEAAKAVSAALLNGEPVGFSCDFPVEGMLPDGLVSRKGGTIGIRISLTNEEDFSQTCWLLPRIVTLGIGCKRGVTKEAIEKATSYALQANHLYRKSVVNMASIDKKRDETGILDYCKAINLPCNFFSAEALFNVKGEFTRSEFVEKTVGVDNVCERAAVLGSNGGKLLVRKTVFSGVTVAAAAAPLTVQF